MTHPTDALRLVRDDHEVIKRCVERMPPLYMRGQTEGSYLHSDIATLIDIVGRLSAAPASPLPGGGWQDISTAPKDGTEVLIYRDGWRCLRCKVAWDQDDEAPSECSAGDEYGFVTDQPTDPVVQRQFEPRQATDRPTSHDIGFLAGMVKDMHERNPHVVDPDSLTEYERRLLPFSPPTKEAPKSDPMKRQVQGDHYRKLVIQPTEFCMRNGLDFCVGNILKYVTRHRAKNGIEDLKKGRHFVEIREAFPFDIHPPRHIVITMLEYVTRNNIRPDDAEALYRLEAYYGASEPMHQRAGAQRLIAEIDRLIASTY